MPSGMRDNIEDYFANTDDLVRLFVFSLNALNAGTNEWPSKWAARPALLADMDVRYDVVNGEHSFWLKPRDEDAPAAVIVYVADRLSDNWVVLT